MLPTVTSENYFSPEVQTAYISASQFKAFQQCEAAALAELEGEYTKPVTTAMLVGSYVDAYFGGALDSFAEQNPEIFKKNGALKAEYTHANKIISRLEQDELYMLLMSGKKQVIATGEIAGVPFKIKMDSLLDAKTCEEIAERFPKARTALGFCDGAIVDQKVMVTLKEVWSDEYHERISFVRAWGYDLQGAIYQAVEGHMLPFILAACTKEEEPDFAALYVPDQELSAKLAEVKQLAPKYQAIKEHKIEPERCGKCAYCRSRKKLSEIIDFRMLGGKQYD